MIDNSASGILVTLDITVYRNYGEGYWAQSRYLVHGFDDTLWTNDLEAALNYLKEDIKLTEIKHETI